jgi:hypothetical protein
VTTFDLEQRKKVKISKYHGNIIIDIREYYYEANQKEMKPGKKGIALNLE